MLGPQHMILPDHSESSDDENNNHQDTGSGDQNDYL